MDTAGKGGVLRSAVGVFDPQGVRIKAFKAPTAAERAHDFLWRVEKEVPGVGLIGIFDRSHYEDVLIARVRKLAPAREIERRYDAINEFEARLVASGTALIKCMLHISSEEQKARLRARLDDPDKHWKFNPGDVDERALWPHYQAAYEVALERCNTDARAVADRPERPQVVQELGGRARAARGARGDEARMAAGRLRRGRAETPARSDVGRQIGYHWGMDRVFESDIPARLDRLAWSRSIGSW
jgi:hypothetical protein